MATRSIDEVKEEAIKRLKALKVHPKVLKDFEEEGKLNKSELCGILFWLDDSEKKMVFEFEEEHDAVVYYVIHQYTNIGELYSLLYVSFDDEEWKLDMADLEAGRALAYVINKTAPDCSEFGSIGIKLGIGGSIRTA